MAAMNDAERESVEAVEVRGLQWLDTGHYRKKPPQFGYNPHDWNPLTTVAQHQRILAALADNSGKPNLSAGCKAVPHGFMPIPTAEQLAEALENVRSFHDMSAELIAPELLSNLLAALAAGTGQEVGK